MTLLVYKTILEHVFQRIFFSMITYVIKIRTGDLDCAGTDANVFITIKGCEGSK